ncbi:MAG: class I SAM-dependent methyltransferase [Acidobacteriota bacterium]|jgi:SAM-dependent methyltransferase
MTDQPKTLEERPPGGSEDPRVNFCDVDDFFERYSAKRSKEDSMNDILIDPAVESLLDGIELQGRRALDVGCGWGELAAKLADRGAEVVAFDQAGRMIERALRERGDRGVEFLHTTLDAFDPPPSSFDLVVSVMSIHYVEDLVGAFRRIHGWLRPGGHLCVMMEHPCVTASVDLHGDGTQRHSYINHYFEEGPRLMEWLTVPVLKQHHTMEGIVGGLLRTGYRLVSLVEPHPHKEVQQKIPKLDKVSNFPHYLGFKARKEDTQEASRGAR